MKKIYKIITISLLALIPFISFAATAGVMTYSSSTPGWLTYLLPGTNGQVLQITGGLPTWGSSGGGGSGGGTFSTSTAYGSVLNNYSNNSTDVVEVGGNSTSTAKFFFDPNIPLLHASSTVQSELMYRTIGNGLVLNLPLVESTVPFYDRSQWNNNATTIYPNVTLGTTSPWGVGVTVYKGGGIKVPASASLHGMANLTASISFMATTTANLVSGEIPLGTHQTGTSGVWFFSFISANTIRFGTINNSGTGITCNPTGVNCQRVNLDATVPNGNFADGQWHQITGTYNQNLSIVTIYYDGKPLLSAPQTGNLNTTNAVTCVGNFDGGSGQCSDTSFGFVGSLSQPLIWNRALNPNEVASLYNEGAVGAVFTATTTVPVLNISGLSGILGGAFLAVDTKGNVISTTTPSGTGGSGTVTSIATNNGLTGGTITTSGTLGLDLTSISNNALLTYNGTRESATGTPTLYVGNIVATSSLINATSTFAGGINVADNSNSTDPIPLRIIAGTNLGTAGQSVSLGFYDNTNQFNTGQIKSIAEDGTHVGLDFSSFTYPAGLIEGLRISGVGNIGIGSTTPFYKLSVEGKSSLGNNAIAGSFTATTTTASIFPNASTTQLTLLGPLYDFTPSAGVAGNVLMSRGAGLAPQWVATTSSSGGVASIAQTYGGAQIGAVTLATSSDSFNGLNANEIITNIGNAFTFSDNITGTLTVAGGGTGVSSQTTNGVTYDNGSNIVSGTGLTFTGTNLGVGSTSPFATASIWNTTSQNTVPLLSIATSTVAGQITTDLQVDSNGNVEIGSTTPNKVSCIAQECITNTNNMADILQLSSHATGITAVTVSDGGGAVFGGLVSATRFSPGLGTAGNPALALNGAATGIYGPLANSIGFSIQGNQAGIITQTGLWGIGTSTPIANLSVSATNTNQVGPIFAVAYPVTTGTATGTAMVVGINGNVGIGTTSPWSIFSTQGAVAMNGLTVFATGDSALCLRPGGQVTSDSGVTSCIISSKYVKNFVADDTLTGAEARIAKLRPILFTYKDSGKGDIGLYAEDVAMIDYRYAQYTQVAKDIDGHHFNVGDPTAINWSAITADMIVVLQAKNTPKTSDDVYIYLGALSVAVIIMFGLIIKKK